MASEGAILPFGALPTGARETQGDPGTRSEHTQVTKTPCWLASNVAECELFTLLIFSLPLPFIARQVHLQAPRGPTRSNKGP